MMKICLLADAESIHTRKWVDYFSEFYTEIHLISMRDTDYKYGDNVKVYVVKPKYKNKLSYFFSINEIKRLVHKIKPDILHSHYATSYGLYGKMCNYHPFVISTWGSDVYEFPKKSRLHEKLLKFILSGSDSICCTSNDMAVETKKYCDKDVTITPFGVDTELFDNKVPVLNNDYITIGITKNLEKIYGINYLIEAFSKLLKEYDNKDIRLMIVGDGSERDNLKRLCSELDIESNVEFTGAVDNNEVAEYINKMDLVCMPSINESFGVAAVEAFACGRPVIASNVGGLKEIIKDGINGYLVKSEDSEDLKNKLMDIISDPQKLQEFSQNARKSVENKYNWDNNAKLMWNLYKNLLESDKVKYNKTA